MFMTIIGTAAVIAYAWFAIDLICFGKFEQTVNKIYNKFAGFVGKCN